MGNMINPNTDKQGPIRVTEDDKHFVVEIHPNDRDRAKMISGRQWDGKRIAWVYEKAPETYDALVAEFKRDADTFEIRRPKTKRPPDIKAASLEEDDEDFEWPALDELGEGQSRLRVELAEIRTTLNIFGEAFADQERQLESISASQKQLSESIGQAGQRESLAVPEPIEVLPEDLDLENQAHLQLIERALIGVAYLASEKHPSFIDWVMGHRPLGRPSKFVTDAHEILKEQLEKHVGDVDASARFVELINRVQDENLIYCERGDPVQVFPMLRALNAIRNRFAHPRGNFGYAEQLNRSITYLMYLSLVWPKIMIDQDTDD
ncbi:hypothetical protein [Woeseia oceani]|uniref:Uncharacterized protein n=1 Tax=Woeseia oceani TaxID=1548547 RepID=A0A193LH65_9GAMM|nr:hypothetical protein [Woeseia oceani]ANO51880.1 hypothetical protein BA177_12315 [Woeseia oceani]